jgi:hypothetical protein
MHGYFQNLTLSWDGGRWSTSHPGCLPPGKSPSTDSTGAGVCLRASLDRSLISCSPPPLQGFETRTVQPIASRYTDQAMPAQSLKWCRQLGKIWSECGNTKMNMKNESVYVELYLRIFIHIKCHKQYRLLILTSKNLKNAMHNIG